MKRILSGIFLLWGSTLLLWAVKLDTEFAADVIIAGIDAAIQERPEYIPLFGGIINASQHPR